MTNGKPAVAFFQERSDWKKATAGKILCLAFGAFALQGCHQLRQFFVSWDSPEFTKKAPDSWHLLFAYTHDHVTLKMTAQLYPLMPMETRTARLELKQTDDNGKLSSKGMTRVCLYFVGLATDMWKVADLKGFVASLCSLWTWGP